MRKKNQFISPAINPALSIPQLRTTFDGRVIGPEDADYDQARTVFMGGFDLRPAVIIRAANPGDGSAYVNFLGNEGVERVRAAYPGSTWEQLVAVKRRYDPANLFRLNQNISPEG